MTDATQPAGADLSVLYEDNHLLGLCKPPGLLVQGDSTGDDTLLEAARRYIKDAYNKPGNVFVGLVHRIDRPVSGVVLFARTSKAASRLTSEFRARRVHKVYYAVVMGSVSEAEGELFNYIERVHRRSRAVAAPGPKARDAVLRYVVLDRREGRTLLEVKPETGRHHQIRLQLAEAGFPIEGDLKYGARVPLPDKSVALHGGRLEVAHPTRDETVVLSARPPRTGPWELFPTTIANRFV